ncbi:benzaldehyde dehydrogenase [Saccharomonospora xinjiangensis]|uniref:benzaldehyde dehydrogenase n=1 Tax=Saccharomonospora xinjiangensis TaxID=75294 RepID=UPI00106FB8F5|nr:benzaldehyde dehydrogenase [Saccharomonospora xinjiangensis]QBQ59909.1 Benzaldehyde dehydrogenase [NAD(+)] [Saccharomonospora xinjiangensis]
MTRGREERAAVFDVESVRGQVFSSGWREAGGGSVEVTEPATGAVLTVTGLADADDIRSAVRSAELAQPSWATLAPADRAAVLRNAASLLETHREDVAAWLIREGGAVAAKAEFEIRSAIDELWAAAALPTQPHGCLLPADPGHHSVGRRVPLGVVGVISPWNFPLVLALRAVAPALALGNAVVLKPDVHTPVSGGVVIARLFELAGLPRDVLHVLPGDAGPGRALTEHPAVGMIAFTGSTTAGREVGAVAGRSLKRVSLELGGNNALIVLEDADLDAASSAGAWGSFLHQGQICMAAGRHIVVESVAGDYVERLTTRARGLTVGDPWTEKVALGPLIDSTQLSRVDRIVRDSVAAGAHLCAGGQPRGLFYPPTVLSGVTGDMPAFTEEIFGPVAPVIVVRDEDEAVEVANRTEYGLSAAVQTGSAERGVALAARLHTGIVHVNGQTIDDNAYVPFGGRGASGNGSRHGAPHSWDEFTQWQWLTVRGTAPLYPF